MEAWLAAIAAVVALVVVAALAARDRRAIGAIRSDRRGPVRWRPGRCGPGSRHRAEQLEADRARDAQDRDAFVDALSQGVLTVDDGSRIVGANAAAHALLDQAPGALLGRTLIEAFIDTQVEAVAHAALEIGSATGEVAVAGADGPKLVLRARRAPSGGLWIVMEDVSELRRLQQIRAEFIDNLSHELRTPLTTVSLLAETLTREAEAAGDSVPARMRDRIGKIEVETGHLVQMVSELLDLSRIESGGALGVVDLLDLGPGRDRIGRAAAAVRRPPGRHLRGRRAGGRSRAVRGDEQRLGQVFVNLLHNAVKFSPDGGEVRVSVVAAGAEVVVAIADHGVGIPRAAQARIFERFYKVDRARVRGEAGGTGLGLAIARHIIEQHGGRIWVESVEGSGSTFSFSFPIAAAHRRPDQPIASEEPDGPPARRDPQHPEPRRPLVRAAAAPARRHGGAPARPARAPGGRLPDAAGPPDRGGRRGPLRRGPRLGGPAGVRQQPARPGAARSPTDVERLDLGCNRSAHRGARSRCRAARRSSSVVTHLHHLGPDEAIRDEQTAALLEWLDEAPAADATIVMGDFNADPAEPTPGRMRAAGFRSAFAEANGAEPAVTWPSGLQAPAMDTDGEPECLDYIWLRGAVRVESARLVFDRPDPRGPDALPERPPRDRRPARDRVGVGECRLGRSGSRTGATGGAAPENTHRRVRSPPWRSPPATASSSTSGPRPTASRSSVHDATLERVQGRPERVDALTRGALEALGVPTLADVLDDGRAAAVPRRRAQERPGPSRRRGPRRRPRAGAVERGRVVVRRGRARADRRASPRPGRAGSTATRSTPTTIDDARSGSAAAAIAVEVAGARTGRRSRRATAAGLEVAAWTVRAARRSTGSRGSAWSRSAWRPARSTARTPRDPARRRRARRTAWRIARISWSSGRGRSVAGRRSSRRPTGSGASSSLERGLAGMGASSRAAGIVRAQGGTPATVALGRWSIDFYNGQQAAYGTDSGFRELGYLILAVTEDDERAGRERVAMQRANGLDVSLARCRGGRGDRRHARARRSSRRQLRRDRRRDRSAPQRPRLLARDAGGRRRAARADGLHRPAHGPDRATAARASSRSRPTPASIETERVLLTGGPCLRAVGRLAGVRIPAGAARHTVAVLEPHPAFDVERMPMVFDIGAGLYWRLEEGGLLFGWSDPDEIAGRGARDRLGVLRADAGAAGRPRPGRPATSACARSGPRPSTTRPTTCRSSGRRCAADGATRSRA